MKKRYPSLKREEPLHIFSYKLKIILELDEIWAHIKVKRPQNAYSWLAMESGLSPSYLYRLVKNDVNISLDRAGNIASVLKLPLWEMIKPDYEILDAILEEGNDTHTKAPK